MNENQKLLNEIRNLRNIIAEKNTEFSKLGGSKQLKIVHEKIKEREEMIAEANNMDQGFNPQNTDNYDNSDEKQIQVKKRYIEQLRQRRDILEQEHQQLMHTH